MNLKLDWCTYKSAKYAVMRWHYSRCMPSGKLVKVGVWEDGNFIGVVLFGRGANKDLLKPYGVTQTEGCELVRIALRRGHKSTVTRIVKIAIKLLKGLCPGIKLIVSFADPEQGHLGKIYQAGNWIYTGRSNAADEYKYRGRLYHGRSFRSKFKGMERHPDVKIVKGSSKYRYLYPLHNDIKELIMRKSKEYPKCAGSIDSDASTNHVGEGGAIPTSALHNVNTDYGE